MAKVLDDFELNSVVGGVDSDSESVFPVTVACPICGAQNTVPKSDFYNCTSCTKQFYVDSEGKAQLAASICGGGGGLFIAR